MLSYYVILCQNARRGDGAWCGKFWNTSKYMSPLSWAELCAYQEKHMREDCPYARKQR